MSKTPIYTKVSFPDSYNSSERRKKSLYTGSKNISSDYNKVKSVIDKYPRYIATYKEVHQSLEEFGTFTYTLDTLIEIPNSVISNPSNFDTSKIKIIELEGSKTNLEEVTSNFERSRNCKIIVNPHSSSIDDLVVVPETSYKIYLSGAEMICLASNQDSPYTQPESKYNKYIPFKRLDYKSYLKFPTFTSHYLHVSGSYGGSGSFENMEYRMYLSGGEYIELDTRLGNTTPDSEVIKRPTQRRELRQWKHVREMSEISPQIPSDEDLLQYNYNEVSINEMFESGSWGLSQIYSFNKLLKDETSYDVEGYIYYDPRNLSEKIEIQDEEEEIVYIFDFYKKPKKPFLPKKNDIIRTLLDEKVLVEFEIEGSGSIFLGEDNLEIELGKEYTFSLGQLLELKSISADGWVLDEWVELEEEEDEEIFISNDPDIDYLVKFEDYPFDVEEGLKFVITGELEPHPTGSLYPGFYVKPLEKQKFLDLVESTLEEETEINQLIPLSLFTYININFIDNKLILKQPASNFSIISGVQTPPFKSGYIIPEDMSYQQKENIPLILNKLRKEGIILSKQELGSRPIVNTDSGMAYS